MDTDCNTDCEAIGEEPHGVNAVATSPVDDCQKGLVSSTSYPAIAIAASSSSARVRSGSPTNLINLQHIQGTTSEINHILVLQGDKNTLVKMIPSLDGRIIVQKDEETFRIVAGNINNLVQLRTELNPDFVLGAYKNRNVCDQEGCPCFQRIRFVKIPLTTDPVTPIVATDDTAETEYMTPVNIAVLANDTGDTLSVLSVTEDPCLTIEIEMDGTITVTPLEGCSGIFTFQYTITDAYDQTDTATVTVTVAAEVIPAPTPPDCFTGNIVYWFDASTLTGADLDPVETLPDISGNARDVTQADGTKQPLLRTADRNGLNVIEFDGTNDSLVGPSFSEGYVNSTAALLAVVQWDSSQPSGGVALSRRANSSRIELIQFTNTPGIYAGIGEITAEQAYSNGSNWALIRVDVVNSTLPGIDYRLIINGSVIFTQASYAIMSSTASTLRIGHRNHGFGEEAFFKGKIGEMILIADWDEDCIDQYEDYLKNKWGFSY
jgi:hypothetical protein